MTAPLADGFADRVAVVTGGASGIGRALVEALVAAGAKVVIADVEKDRLAATTTEIVEATGGEVVAVVTDVTDPESVEALAEETYRRFGACHLLMNNAGVGAPATKVWDTTPNDWRWVHSVNVFGVAYGIQSFVPRMLAGGEPGHVVNTSSGDGSVMPIAAASVYASSKAAVGVITECLALQFETEGAPLAASLFLPAGGLLDTGMWTADRNRPDHLAREKPRDRPSMTVAQVVAMAEQAGRPIRLQPLGELAAIVLDGIRAGSFCLTIGLEADAEILAERAQRFGQGLNPAYAIDHGIGV
jgi:NAD(P)-dependent dehydrogenase (short-subunit alcohol dehydrogenase family)